MSWIAKIKTLRTLWKLTPEQIQQAASLKAGENVEAMREQLLRIVHKKGWTHGEIVKALGGKINNPLNWEWVNK